MSILRSLAFLAALLLAFPATAQTEGSYCAPIDAITKRLAQRYSESVVARGLASNGHALLIYASRNGETYTAVMVNPNGIACIVSTGTAYGSQPPAEEGTES